MTDSPTAFRSGGAVLLGNVNPIGRGDGNVSSYPTRSRRPSPSRPGIHLYPREARPGACALPPVDPEGSTSTPAGLDQEPAPFPQ
jgi:hypothetical protein